MFLFALESTSLKDPKHWPLFHTTGSMPQLLKPFEQLGNPRIPGHI